MLQLPGFTGAPWMRTPSIVYGTSLITMKIPMLGYLALDDFRLAKIGPVTVDQRLRLLGIYGSFFLGGWVILVDFYSVDRSQPNLSCGRK